MQSTDDAGERMTDEENEQEQCEGANANVSYKTCHTHYVNDLSSHTSMRNDSHFLLKLTNRPIITMTRDSARHRKAILKKNE